MGLNVMVDEIWVDVTSRHLFLLLACSHFLPMWQQSMIFLALGPSESFRLVNYYQQFLCAVA
jgi:hypothetical protein